MGIFNVDGVKPVVVCGPSRTKQSFKQQTDINSIVARYAKTGMVSHLNAKQPFYGDVSHIADYQTALGVVQKAHDLFNGLSATVRERFSNDPIRMINFLQDSKNVEEAISLGIVVKRPVEAVEAVKPVGEVIPPKV